MRIERKLETTGQYTNFGNENDLTGMGILKAISTHL